MFFHLFKVSEWGAHEELLLLEGMQRHGFANWSKISEHVSSKTKDECKNHYSYVYLSTESLMPVASERISSEVCVYGQISYFGNIFLDCMSNCVN